MRKAVIVAAGILAALLLVNGSQVVGKDHPPSDGVTTNAIPKEWGKVVGFSTDQLGGGLGPPRYAVLFEATDGTLRTVILQGNKAMPEHIVPRP